MNREFDWLRADKIWTMTKRASLMYCISLAFELWKVGPAPPDPRFRVSMPSLSASKAGNGLSQKQPKV